MPLRTSWWGHTKITKWRCENTVCKQEFGPKEACEHHEALGHLTPIQDTVKTDACIIIVGNVVDGYTFHGPYLSRTEAISEANEIGLNEWWIAKLTDL